jgi:competence protein ComEC
LFSGFNVGLVAFAVMLILKILRLPRCWRFLFAMPVLILYCIATGASSPVVRATIMAFVFILAQLVNREPDIYNSLSLAALSVLAINPQQLFDIGFQLSFASVLAIVFLYPKIKNFFRLDTLKIKCLKFILEGCLVSFSAWVGTMGLIAYYFKIFSPVTVLANLVIVPLASLITLCGFSLVILGGIFPVLAPYLARSNELLVIALISLNNLFIRLPGSHIYLQI